MTRFLVDLTRAFGVISRFLRVYCALYRVFSRAFRAESAFLLGILRCGVIRARRNARFCECAQFKTECCGAILRHKSRSSWRTDYAIVGFVTTAERRAALRRLY